MNHTTEARATEPLTGRRAGDTALPAQAPASGAPNMARLGLISHQFHRATLLALLRPLLQDAQAKTRTPALLLLHAGQPLSLRDIFGRAVEEDFRLAVADVLCRTVREADLVLRHSEFCFAIILDTVAAGDIERVARRLVLALGGAGVPTSVGHLVPAVTIGAAIASVAEPDGFDPDRLVQNAEDALDEARDGTNRFILHAAEAGSPSGQRRLRAVAEDILSTLDEARLVLAFQPIVSAKTGALFCHEALSRIRTDDGTLVPPAAFFPVAERTGLIRRIDRRVLDLALDHLAAHPEARLSINLSLLSAHDAPWMALASERLARQPEAGSRLILEITETAAIDDLDATAAMIRHLKALGVGVAMDDFGAGFSSFRNLRHLGIDLLKIDGAFVRNLLHSPDDGKFVQALLSLAQHLRIPVVAEWVEDEATASRLAEWGVDYFQGHLFGRAEVGW